MFKLDLEKAEEPEIKMPTSTGSLEKVGKTTIPFRYDLKQIPYDYTVEVTSDSRD